MSNPEIKATSTTIPCPAEPGRKTRITIDPTHPRIDAALDEQRTNAMAAALYIARYGYKLAVASPNPAARLDDMCDTVAEVWDEITPRLPKKFAGADREFAETMRAAVADRLWAFTVVAHAKAEAGDSFGYVFDVLADSLNNGADPQTVRAEVPRVAARVRIHQARANADGPWAGILDILLAAIEEGADPQQVIDQALALMAQVRSEKPAA
ncbi:hypothetical protein QBB33_15565 [Streptomyces scabiei]|uniref:hypothetical protein n=1 Tax=Streptomyces scabiei TaxID=1930 RepID=UPI002FF25732